MPPERPTETLAKRDILPMSRPRKRIPESCIGFSLAMSRLNPATTGLEGQRDNRDKPGQCPACPDRDTGHHPIGGVPPVPRTENGTTGGRIRERASRAHGCAREAKP
jgi:hypothetical protein